MPPYRTLCLLFWCCLLSACATTGIARIEANYSGVPREYMHLGDQASAIVQAARPIIHDPVLTNYLLGIKRTLLAHVKTGPVPGKIYVLDDNAVYALVTSNGDIFLSSGILRLARSRSELAPVIGYLLSHILLGHFAEINEQAARITKALFRTGGKLTPEHAETNIAFGAVLYFGMRRKLSLAADRVMLQLQERAGYDPCGVEFIFRKLVALDQMTRTDSSRTRLFDTHPASAERLRLIEERLRGKGCDGKHASQSATYRLNVLDRLPRE